MGWSTVLQGVKQEAELLFLFRLVDAQQTEHRLLHFLAVDTDRTTTQLGAVQHHVVGTRQGSGRVGLQLFRRALGCGERVVQRTEAAVVVLFEHREVDDPHRRPLAGQQVQVVTELDAQRTQSFADDLGLVGTKEHDVAIDRTDAIEDHVQVGFRDILDDRRLQTVNTGRALVDLDVRQALGTVDADELGVVVDLLARHARPARNAQCGDTAFRVVGRAAEHLEFDFLELVGNVNQFQRDTQVRFVRTVATHRLFEGHVREFAEFQIQHFLEQVADHAFGQAHDVFFIEEAGLDVDLGELRLAVGTQVFVAEALGDLVVTVETGHHQQLLEQLRQPITPRRGLELDRPPAADPVFRSSFTQGDYERAVDTIKEYILAGDCMQVVPSQRMSIDFKAAPIDLYRALRCFNPTPYMYFFNFGDFHVVGSSPEVLVRVEDNLITVRPIAGTRPRGATEEADRALEEDLLSDDKEIAEHLMLIDLGRNDTGRVSEIGSVKLTEKMVIERYSNVMHIVSNVTGQLKSGLTSMDALRAILPAGTLSGAPKIRAMEIIDELEPVKRGVYGGAVGYYAWNGNMDTAIAIRTAVIKDGELHVQAGGGIVADSVPALEWEETLNKRRAMFRAVALAEQTPASDA